AARLREDDAALRDALLLAAPGAALSPAGRLHALFRLFGAPRFTGDHDDVERAGELLGLAGDRAGYAEIIRGRCHVNDWVAFLARQDRHDPTARELQAPPLPAANHRPRRLALLPVPAQPTSCRGDAARTRDRSLLRNHPPRGHEIRTRLCPPPEAQKAGSARRLVSR
ncbi:DUF1403 family protein, partial [Methylocystis sp. Sn-Cys]|nr:DUF1403 family protein [Methylocystis sp. Sn-Cys]